MAYQRTRRSSLFSAVVSGVVLCLAALAGLSAASLAFACSPSFNGEMKVWGAGGGTVTAIGQKQPKITQTVGGVTSTIQEAMSYCAGYPNGSVSFSHGSIETLTVSMASATDACVSGNQFANKLVAGWYDVNIIQTDAFTAVWKLDTGNGDCMDGVNQGAVTTGSISLNAVGNGLGTVTYSAGAFQNSPGKAGGICVTSFPSGSSTMEAPVIFI